MIFYKKKIKEEKERVLSNLGYEYHQVYKLGGLQNRYESWYLTDFAIDYLEEVLLRMHYRTYDVVESGGYGRIEYTFYLVRKDDKYYFKYFNMYSPETEAGKIGRTKILNGAVYEECRIGSMTSEYKRYILENVMRVSHELKKEELMDKLAYIKKADYSEVYLKGFSYVRATTTFDIIDFYNGNRFYSDDYCVKDFEGIIELSNYIFENCKINELVKNNLVLVKDIKEAQKRVLFEVIEWKYAIL